MERLDALECAKDSSTHCADQAAITTEGEDATPNMSKNKLRKLRKQEMKLKYRPEKRRLERERRKEKRKQALEAGEILPPSRKQLRKESRPPADICVVVDCSYEEYMSENDIKKLVKQLQHCYAINRRAEQPFKYHVTSHSGKTKDIIDNLAGAQSWDVKWAEQSYHEVFAKDDIIYLSAESDNVLESLEEGKAYVIGGLVDHNREKGLCHRLAAEKGITHAQLPISQYIDLKCRKVLTIDHVFEILNKYHELKDWKSAFFAVIPKRKGAQEKEEKEGTTGDESTQGKQNIETSSNKSTSDNDQKQSKPEESSSLGNGTSHDIGSTVDSSAQGNCQDG